jgi:hypothetical protein
MDMTWDEFLHSEWPTIICICTIAYIVFMGVAISIYQRYRKP